MAPAKTPAPHLPPTRGLNVRTGALRFMWAPRAVVQFPWPPAATRPERTAARSTSASNGRSDGTNAMTSCGSCGHTRRPRVLLTLGNVARVCRHRSNACWSCGRSSFLPDSVSMNGGVISTAPTCAKYAFTMACCASSPSPDSCCFLVGWKTTLEALAPRLRCSQCGRKDAEVVAVARPRPRGIPKNPH
jgi:hypothetical protein